MKHYVILSGIIGSVLTALLVSPVTAQRDKFGEIECTKLTVVDADGKARALLNTDMFDGYQDDTIRVRVTGGELVGIVEVFVGWVEPTAKPNDFETSGVPKSIAIR